MKILKPQDVPAAVEHLVREAQVELVLISAYFKPWGRLKKAISDAAYHRKVKTVLMARSGPELDKHITELKPLMDDGAIIMVLDRLHAKIYLNEKSVIMTSMNLVEASAHGSWESAIEITKARHPAAYAAIVNECVFLIREADREIQKALADSSSDMYKILAKHGIITKRQIGSKVGKKLKKASTSAKANSRVSARLEAAAKTHGAKKRRKPARPPKKGTCIRCGVDIQFNTDRPCCYGCYQSWAKWGNKDYEENFCHACGKETPSSMAKPLCQACYLVSVFR